MFAPYRSVNYKYTVPIVQSAKQHEYLEKLEKKLEQQENGLTKFTQNFFKFSNGKNFDKKEYAKELTRQIEEKRERMYLEKGEHNKPAISDDFHGYPNIPQTPEKEKRQKEKIRMKIIKEELDQQVLNKFLQNKQFRIQEIESEQKINTEIMRKTDEVQREKKYAKGLEKELLTSSWQNAQKSKEIETQLQSIEFKGFNPRSRSVFGKDDSISPQKTGISDKFSVENSVITEIKPTDYFTKAEKLKTEIDEKYQSSYQFKIKKIMEEAKSHRKIITKSLSPSDFLKRKVMLKSKFGRK